MGRAVAVYAARFVLGGVIVASLPIVAVRVSPKWAGVMAVMPLITLVGFAFVALSDGPSTLQRVAFGALVVVPAIVVYLVVVYVCLALSVPWRFSLAAGAAAWLASALLLVKLV